MGKSLVIAVRSSTELKQQNSFMYMTKANLHVAVT